MAFTGAGFFLSTMQVEDVPTTQCVTDGRLA
jgi:hypothetical protein